MADSCKAKTPTSSAKKAHERSGKKRSKNKKSAESVDGTPSPKSAQSSPGQPSTSQPAAIQPQTRLEGATAGVNICPSPDTKLISIENDAVAEIKPIRQSQSNSSGRDGLSSEVLKKNIPKAKSNCCEHAKKDELKFNEGLLDNKTKEENKNKRTDEQAKNCISDGRDNSTTGLHLLRGNTDSEAASRKEGNQQGCVRDSQKGNIKAEKVKSSASNVPHQKPTDVSVIDSVKTAEQRSEKGSQVKGAQGVDSKQQVKGENKQQTKVDQKAEPGVDGEQKSKAQLRAERRAVQEAQRAAKDAKKLEIGASSLGAAPASSAMKEHGSEKSKPVVDVQTSERSRKKSGGETGGDENRRKPAGDQASGEKSKKKSGTDAVIRAETEEEMWVKREDEILRKSLKIDNSIMNLGFQYFHHNIVGANARCLALLATLKEVIAKYKTPEEKELARDLEKNCLNPCISYINYCRPISTSMGNAIRHLKFHINNIPSDMKDETAIAKLLEVIDNFIEVNMTKASEGVADNAFSKIDDGDVILVYAASSLIAQVLKKAFKRGKKFRVIVVEGRPRNEGKSMLRCLVRCGIPCSYVYIGSASHAMSEATKVFLGAAAMFAIGDMYSRSGNSIIAALAKANNLPVLVCCETYKFTDKVQLHTGDSNLHTQGKDLVSIGHRVPILSNWEEIGLGLLNLMYDVTGSVYITAVVTELGMLPCTSVPVVLRRQEELYF